MPEINKSCETFGLCYAFSMNVHPASPDYLLCKLEVFSTDYDSEIIKFETIIKHSQPNGRLSIEQAMGGTLTYARRYAIMNAFGLSFDEPRRVERVRANYHGRKGWVPEFPLFDDMMTREDCVAYLQKRLPGYTVPRSACVFCPYKRDSEWILLRDTDPKGWQRAIEIDRAIREETSVCTKGMNATQYLHKSCVPLEFVELRADPPDRQAKFRWSDMDCEGMCGS
jgi:hypothetical protein